MDTALDSFVILASIPRMKRLIQCQAANCISFGQQCPK